MPVFFFSVCADLLFVHFRVQKKTTSMSLTIRSSSPKTTEVLPRRSTLVQSLSQPPLRVSTYRTQDSRSTQAHKCGLNVENSPPVQKIHFIVF